MDAYARSYTATSSSSSSAHDQCREAAEPSCFLVEDLFDFTAVEAMDDGGGVHHNYADIPPFNVADHQYGPVQPDHLHCYDFNDVVDLCVPSDDVAELEWLSHFVGGEDDSSSFYRGSILPSTMSPGSEISTGANRRGGLGDYATDARSNHILAPIPATAKPSRSRRVASSIPAVRRCTHCLSEKTPQWRTGPAGPKTLCNACGVRFKSGRLVPEYRPAASPTFVLTQHSNSHRKVMELRRQKEHSLLTRHRQAPEQAAGNPPEQLHAQHQFRVC